MAGFDIDGVAPGGYGCETWSIIRREQYKETEVLRRIFGPERGEATEGWKVIREA
jgi:hypothetical protein